MKRIFPVTIDFRLTSKCNMNCRYCFGTKIESNIHFEDIISFFSYAFDNGCENIVFTGGEPTLHPYFEAYVEKLKNIGYKLFLSSNGMFWENPQIRSLVMDNFECISLPVDAGLASRHNYMRRASFDHYNSIMTVLNEFKDYSDTGGPRLKIGTVVNKLNIDETDKILDTIPVMPDIWKLYQLSKSNVNAGFYEKYSISDNEFMNCVKLAKKKYSKMVSVTYSFEHDRDGKYLFLEPDGTLMTIYKNKEYPLSNIWMREKNKEKLFEYVDFEKIDNNFVNSFRGTVL